MIWVMVASFGGVAAAGSLLWKMLESWWSSFVSVSVVGIRGDLVGQSCGALVRLLVTKIVLSVGWG